MVKSQKLLLTTVLILLFITTCISLSPIFAATYVPQNSNRVVWNFNTNWLYANYDMTNGRSKTLNDSTFQQVCLPHANKILTAHKNTLNLSDYRFVSWYRRHFTIPSTYSGRRVLVEFQAVTTVADVYVNGTYVGQHKGAYTPFTFDITNNITFGGADNVIAVRVDSTKRGDIPPEVNSEWIDYLLFGGIPRDVRMILADPLRTEWTYVTTPAAPGTNWDNAVRVKTKVVNNSSGSKSCTVVANIVDAANNVVATTTTTATVGANSSYEFNQTTPAISSPHLWSTDDPYLHTAYIQIKDGSNFVDEYKVKVGLRWIDFNKTDGKFWLNGQALKLRGLDRHETYPWIGRSAPNRLQRKDADILKYDLGCNIMRCSHYPDDPEFLDRCDEIGLLVLEETPGWQNLGDQNWKNIVIQNVEDMVMRDRNHPSIVTWGVRVNESGDDSALYTSTNNKARSLDSTRPTCGVRNFKTSQFLEDLYTYNDFSGGIEAPTQQPWLVTEFAGHTFPTHSYDTEQRLIDHALKHAYIQNESYKNATVTGAMGWCAFDYNTTNLFGDPTNTYVCYHGVSDIFRLPKFAAYFYKSQVDPVKYGYNVYIANYWKSGSPTTVTVFSNCPQVELFVNGVSKGVKTPTLYTNLPHGVFQWTGITFAAGNLRADGKNGTATVASFTRYTPGSPTKLTLTPDSTSLIADGGDMTRVVVTAVDSNNQLVPLTSNSVSFSVSSTGKFIGENPFVLEDGKGICFIQSKLDQTGSITVTASASGLTSANTTITVSAMTESKAPVGTPTPGEDPIPVGGIVSGATYKVVSRSSGKLIQVAGNSTADGALIEQWTDNGGNNQKWRIDSMGSGNYKLTNINSGKVLDVPGFSTTTGTQLDQWTDNGGSNQLFKIVDLGGGYSKIINVNSNLALDVNANSTADGAAIIQWTDNGATNQQWQLVATNGVTFYQNADYGGTASQVFGKGNYTMAQLNAKGCPNDWMSSLKIPSGWTVIVYQNDNFTGTSWTFTADTNYVGSACNDQMTSCKIQ